MARGSARARKQAGADDPGVADPTAPFDGAELLTSSFNSQSAMATTATHFIAAAPTYVTRVATSSTTVVVFIAVPDCAP
jgi:hypothetical protein